MVFLYIWTAEDVLLKLFLASYAANLNPPPKIAFPNIVPSTVHESFKKSH